ncbi:hypothetical protein ABFS82_13G116000 [Erythranthe guttata]|uniref:B box-type domain-containing protein n=1 Tax=Erythranthe guttata TaxID=4155 RepID=A0A022QKU9_ERYGU|nr:PREDICTED: zinc finger protein CONSTANS-LIKE 2-like isoform X2 [Erythranthe guttata]EYU27878.1 hypothetical protein MIMGU_mgv1a014444mg [Erythranthe guttata]|eukprot:XP_012849021.1 PREDICTED: zinc finger protein CONSTANS-LIKE 2-like isoform X2 [Erythranthe guttata]
MKKCELCKKVARMYCESDQASLCWDCDSRVHTANFLVGKHTRTLLCHSCQSPTPWTGSGPKLGPTVSVCNACVNGRDSNVGRDSGPVNRNTEDDEDEDEDEDEDQDDDEDDEENGVSVDEDDSENQVVPLSSQPTSSFASTSSGSEEESSRRRDGFTTALVENSRSPYNVVERPKESNRSRNIESWMWR